MWSSPYLMVPKYFICVMIIAPARWPYVMQLSPSPYPVLKYKGHASGFLIHHRQTLYFANNDNENSPQLFFRFKNYSGTGFLPILFLLKSSSFKVQFTDILLHIVSLTSSNLFNDIHSLCDSLNTWFVLPISTGLVWFFLRTSVL